MIYRKNDGNKVKGNKGRNNNKYWRIKMKRLVQYFAYMMLMAVILTGCAKQPTQEIDDTKKAVEAAKAAGSEKYLPDEAKKVNDSLSSALDEIKVQDGKFALLRSYDKAKQMLAAVKSGAEKLKTDTAAKKEEAKKNAISGQAEAKAAVEEAKALLAKAPRGKGSRADIEAMKGDIKGAEDSLAEVQQLIDKEDYLAAIDKAKAIKEKADAISNQIKEALAKVKGKKGAKK